MRIQHNIMAMNAFRNYNSNTSALGRNLEKLSSGYKINRAGDDAAGLAISEKMRAQISGLKQAQANVKDGISLVKTAEGALQEVQDMMNRMVTLATQSANGTYDNDVDRKNLQKEVEALKTEIDRIADSANFNGTKLLDGSLAAEGNSAVVSSAFDDIKGTLASAIEDVDAVNAVSKFTMGTLNSTAPAAGDKLNLNFTMSDGSTYSFELNVEAATDGTNKFTFKDADGNVLYNTASTKITTTDIGNAAGAAIRSSDLGKAYEVSVDGSNGAVTMTHLAGGSEGANITSLSLTGKTSAGADFFKAGNAPAIDITAEKKGADASQALDLSKATLYDGTGSGSTDNLQKAIFEIGGKKFAFYDANKDTKNADKAASIAAMEKEGVTFVKVATTGNIDGADIAKMVSAIAKETGLEVTQGSTNSLAPNVFTAGTATTDTKIMIASGSSTKGNGGLGLQIGDTADEYNQLTVSIGNMHVDALGIGKLDISEQEDAAKAIEAIKTAINTVSGTRGDLGAIQNRLEHTTNNLAIMTENIQDAESTIRDVDIADEMTTYTKNNILLQSAQAMLAQANQMPQGVLQLLQ